MSRSSIPVDLFNPGQVFACLGFAEAVHVLYGDAMAAFDWSDRSQSRFWLAYPGDGSPFAGVLGFLAEADVSSLGTAELITEKWTVPTELSQGDTYPIKPPTSPATLPAILRAGTTELRFDHWGDATRRDNVKFWAGAGGYPGAGLLRDALELIRDRLPEAVEDPFALPVPQSSSFRLDWRRDYVPLDAGFSLNEHGSIVSRGYPLVEILGALGLAHARPRRETKLRYRYGVIACPGVLLPLPLLRAALGAHRNLPFLQRTFRMDLDWPGQENQARCITTVSEETTND